MPRKSSERLFFLLLCLFISATFFVLLRKADEEADRDKRGLDINRKIRERRNMFLIFVGGMPRSGTTLMRTMLDAYGEIRCGLETWVIQEILNMKDEWSSQSPIIAALSDAGVYPTALDNAMAQFILEIIIGHLPPAKYLCNKDPYVLMYTPYVRKLFPNAKFIFMVRDGRAFAHSVVTRGVRISGWNIKSYREVIQKWSKDIQKMHGRCIEVGDDVCLPVYYEKLVLQPVATTKKIFKFLGIPWRDSVLHHEDHLNETALSDLEYSTDQVSKPLYLDALTSWFGKLPKDVERDLQALAPMLSLLGYDPKDPRPDYGEPDEFVRKRLAASMENEKKKALSAKAK